MFLSGFFRGIDTDETDGILLAISDNGDGVTVSDSGALELGGKDDDRKIMASMRTAVLKALDTIRMPSTLCYKLYG